MLKIGIFRDFIYLLLNCKVTKKGTCVDIKRPTRRKGHSNRAGKLYAGTHLLCNTTHLLTGFEGTTGFVGPYN